MTDEHENILYVTQERYSRFWGRCSHIFQLKYHEAGYNEFVYVLEQFKKKSPLEDRETTHYRIISLCSLEIQIIEESIFEILYEIYYDFD